MSRETAQQQERSRETLEPNLDTCTDAKERVGTKNLKDPFAPPPPPPPRGLCICAFTKNEGFVHLHIHIKKKKGLCICTFTLKKRRGGVEEEEIKRRRDNGGSILTFVSKNILLAGSSCMADIRTTNTS